MNSPSTSNGSLSMPVRSGLDACSSSSMFWRLNDVVETILILNLALFHAFKFDSVKFSTQYEYLVFIQDCIHSHVLSANSLSSSSN